MLTHPTYDRLIALGLTGMAKALEEQRRQRNVEGLTFEERLGLLVDREAVERESKRLVSRLKYANLRQTAVVEDLDTKAARGLDRALFAKLASGEWIARHHDLLITGKTGTGKSWLACALGHKACRDDRSVVYYRVPRLLDTLALARGDGRYPRLLKPAPIPGHAFRYHSRPVDDRHGRGSTIVTSQVPVEHWHELIADPTIADAVLDRLVHTAHRLALDGPSMRDPKAIRTEAAPAATQIAAALNIKSAKGAKK